MFSQPSVVVQQLGNEDIPDLVHALLGHYAGQLIDEVEDESSLDGPEMCMVQLRALRYQRTPQYAGLLPKVKTWMILREELPSYSSLGEYNIESWPLILHQTRALSSLLLRLCGGSSAR